MKKILFILFLFISIVSFGQFRNNNPDVFNVFLYGAKADSVTDDTQAFQAALVACIAAGGGTVYVPYSTNSYRISGALQTSVSGVNPNCQIYVPLVHASTRMVSVKIVGGSPTSWATEDFGSTPRSQQGVVLNSTIQGTGTTPSVIGSPWYNAGVVGDRNYVEVTMENIEIRTRTIGVSNNDTLGTMSGINASKFLTFSGNELHVSTSSTIANSVQPTNETYGIILPDILNHAKLDFGTVLVEGYKYGVQLSEHSHFFNLTAIACVNGIKNILGGHTCLIDKATLEANINNISLEGTMSLTITNLEIEHALPATGKWYVNATDINQVSGSSRVQIFNCNVTSSSGAQPFVTAGSPDYIVYNGSGSPASGNVAFWNGSRMDNEDDFNYNSTFNILNVGGAGIIEAPKLRAYESPTSFTTLTHANSGGDDHYPRAFFLGYGNAAPNNFGIVVAAGAATSSTQLPSFLEISTNTVPGQASAKQMILYQTSSVSQITNVTAEAGSTAAQAMDMGFGGTFAGTANLVVKTTGVLQLPTYGAGTATFDASGNISSVSAPAIKYAHTIFTPTTGGTVSLINNQYNIINPAGALLALTVNLPSSPANNDVVYIKFTQTISTVTYANGTVVDGITAPTAGGLTVLTYDSGTTSWY